VREMEFKMERQNLVEVGQRVEVIERSCPANYHYIIKTCSGNVRLYFGGRSFVCSGGNGERY